MDKKRTWDENRQLCGAHNLTMITITKDMIQNGFTVPNGLRKQEYVWLGARAYDMNLWTFVNGILLNETYLESSNFQGERCYSLTAIFNMHLELY